MKILTSRVSFVIPLEAKVAALPFVVFHIEPEVR